MYPAISKAHKVLADVPSTTAHITARRQTENFPRSTEAERYLQGLENNLEGSPPQNKQNSTPANPTKINKRLLATPQTPRYMHKNKTGNGKN